MMSEETSQPRKEKNHHDFKYAAEINANSILFEEVCTDVLEKMHSAKGTEARLNLLTPIWKRVGRQSTFPFLRLLLPQLDSARATYGIKTTKLAKLFAKMYFQDEHSENYQRLIHNTDPAKNPSPDKNWQVCGDFPLTLEYVLQTRECLKKSSCTLKEVNDLLDELKQASNDDKRKVVLGKFKHNFSPMNLKWLSRIILRDLKIHLKKDTVLKRIHEDALDEYNKTTSLRKVCTMVVGRHSSLRFHSDLQVFTSFFPMLAKNFHYDVGKIVPSFQGRPFCMDVKLDGERMICHKEGNRIKWVTRNARDYTERYGPVLDPHMIRGVNAHRCILDGEVVTWDDNAGTMVPFGLNRTYAKEEIDGAGNGTRWLCYVVFDILYAEGDEDEDKAAMDEIVREAARNSRAPCAPGILLRGGNITSLPLDARRRVLRAVVTEHEHRFEIVKTRDVEAGDENERKKQLGDFFETVAYQLNEEGLVVKDLKGHYEMGEKSRNSGLWVKMKPEYTDEFGEMDFIVLAAAYAHGHQRAGFLSKFMLGVAIPTTDGSLPTQFTPVCRAGSGYSMEQLEDINARTKGKWISFDDRPSPHIPAKIRQKMKNREMMPDALWIHPKDSFCMEIKCMEIVRSVDWPSGVTMRFPRITRIRFDKGVEGCLNTTGLAALAARPRTSRTSLSGSGGAAAAGKRRKSVGAGGGKRTRGAWRSGTQVSSLFAMGGGCGAAAGGVGVEADVFVVGDGVRVEFCVLGDGFYKSPAREGDDVDAWWAEAGLKRKVLRGGEKLEKQQLDELIQRNGGTVVANASPNTSFIIVGDKNTISVKNAIACRKYSVVGHRWVLECIEKGRYEFPSFQHLRMTSEPIREALSQFIDEYGDSYTDPADATTLSQLLLNITMPPTTPGGGQGVRVVAALGGGPVSSSSSSSQRMRSWLLPLMSMDPEDRFTLVDSPDFIFADPDRCLVYCDLYQELGYIDPPLETGKVEEQAGPSSAAEVPYSGLGSTAAAVRLHGGDVASSLHGGVTHVIVDTEDKSRYGLLRARIRDLHAREGRTFHIRVVNSGWVEHCVKLGRLEAPADMHLVRLCDQRLVDVL